jgi:hypothetical protein
MFGVVVNRRGELTPYALSSRQGGATVTDMSRVVPMFLLHALIDDFSSVSRPGEGADAHRTAGAQRSALLTSPAIGRRVIHADNWDDAVAGAMPREPDVPLLIHGPAPKALAAWHSVETLQGSSGLDIAQDRERHSIESAHRSLALLAELPRAVPVAVGLALDAGWRDALDLILARGRSVRFAVFGLDSPDSPAIVEAIRTAAAMRCAFSWSSGPWQAVTDPSAGPLPGILNVLLATAVALDTGNAAAIGVELGRTDPVDVVDAVRDLRETTARRTRKLINGFAVAHVASIVDALSDLELLPKARPEAPSSSGSPRA